MQAYTAEGQRAFAKSERETTRITPPVRAPSRAPARAGVGSTVPLPACVLPQPSRRADILGTLTAATLLAFRLGALGGTQ